MTSRYGLGAVACCFLLCVPADVRSTDDVNAFKGKLLSWSAEPNGEEVDFLRKSGINIKDSLLIHLEVMQS